jgi:transposase InsO family protein
MSSDNFSICLLRQPPSPDATRNRPQRPWAEPLKAAVRVRKGVVIDDAQLFNDKLAEWQDFYNYDRPHGALGGQTPYERLRQKTTATTGPA